MSLGSIYIHIYLSVLYLTSLVCSRGFVSFAKPESADRAIAEMHGKSVNGIVLQVQLARRQPQIEPINDASSSAVWSSIGEVSYIYVHRIIYL